MPGIAPTRYVSFTRSYAGREHVPPGHYYRALSIVLGRSGVFAICCCPDCRKTFTVPGKDVTSLGLVREGRVVLCPHCSLNMQVRLMEWS